MNSLFIISPLGLIRMSAPFRLVAKPNGKWKEGTILTSEKVLYHEAHRLIFQINGQWYSHRFFWILL